MQGWSAQWKVVPSVAATLLSQVALVSLRAAVLPQLKPASMLRVWQGLDVPDTLDAATMLPPTVQAGVCWKLQQNSKGSTSQPTAFRRGIFCDSHAAAAPDTCGRFLGQRHCRGKLQEHHPSPVCCSRQPQDTPTRHTHLCRCDCSCVSCLLSSGPRPVTTLPTHPLSSTGGREGGGAPGWRPQRLRRPARQPQRAARCSAAVPGLLPQVGEGVPAPSTICFLPSAGANLQGPGCRHGRGLLPCTVSLACLQSLVLMVVVFRAAHCAGRPSWPVCWRLPCVARAQSGSRWGRHGTVGTPPPPLFCVPVPHLCICVLVMADGCTSVAAQPLIPNQKGGTFKAVAACKWQ